MTVLDFNSSACGDRSYGNRIFVLGFDYCVCTYRFLLILSKSRIKCVKNVKFDSYFVKLIQESRLKTEDTIIRFDFWYYGDWSLVSI